MPTSERRAPGRDRVRTGVVWDAVVARLEHGDPDHDRVRARVVDIGGGTGGFAVRLAREGHAVTVVDPSPDALAALARRADEAGVAGFTLEETHAVRVFADLVPGSLLDLEPGATAALVDLERAVAGSPEYLPLATQVHLLATR
jgi:SAM-dependent methyltransferase